ncbi:MAG TPA: DUF4190 domain-containing protein [Phycisphaerales bacterium]|nr:DUF4190 domain-containing protein [Phycisphaerales bacterium]
MNQNPYEAGADFSEHRYDEPPRTSLLAIMSLVCSLVCFIPGLSAIGSLLGVFALLGISKSEGRVKGTGLAVAGIVVGMLVTVIWFVVVIGMQKAMSQYTNLGQAITDIEAGDLSALRGELSSSTQAVLTDEMVADFKAAYTADGGAFVEWPQGMLQIFGEFMKLGKAGQQPDNTKVPYANAVPLPGKFANGTHLVWVVLDQKELAASSTRPATINVGYTASDNSTIWLVDPDVLSAGPAPTTPDEAAPDEAAPDESGADESPAEGGG